MKTKIRRLPHGKYGWAPAFLGASLSLALLPFAAAQHEDHGGPGQEAAPSDQAEPGPGHHHHHAAGSWLGVSVAPLDEALRSHLPSLAPGTGLLVSEVAPDSPASAAGLRQHDVLLRWEDQILVSLEQLQVLVGGRQPGETARLTLVRGGEVLEQEITLAARPPQVAGPQPAPEPHPPGFAQPPQVPQPPGFPQFPGGPGPGPQIPEEIRRWAERFLEENLVKPGAADVERWADKFRKAFEEQWKGWKPKQQGQAEAPEAEGAPEHSDHPPSVPGAGQPPPADPAPGPAVSSVSKIVVSDGEGSTELTVTDGKKHVVFKDAEGNVVFEGPCNTDEERNAIPAHLREKVDRLSLRAHPPQPGENSDEGAGAGLGNAIPDIESFFRQFGEGGPEGFAERLQEFFENHNPGGGGKPRID
ncbi:MAG TPA: PDZ domain-containing protein [Verrucomicrobiales bacterium]|nr:PDZ domain-containing protein [Verrucomicrobiales bacterium]